MSKLDDCLGQSTLPESIKGAVKLRASKIGDVPAAREFHQAAETSRLALVEGLRPSSVAQGDLDALRASNEARLRGDLYASEPQKAIPVEKLAAFVAVASRLVNQGIDTPQKLASELDALFEGGKARPYSQALWDAIGMVKPELRGTHDWGAIYLSAPTQDEKKGQDLPKNSEQLTRAIYHRILTEPLSRTELTALASESGLDAKRIDEAAELAVVIAARSIARGPGSVSERFDKLVDLYNRQPNLTAKTSTSKVNQAYSTPAPLAFAAGILADLSNPSVESAYEPTAGNGLLTIAGDPATFHVNEMDPTRADQLEGQGFSQVTRGNALDRPRAMVERIIMNPPFGTILDDNGNSREFPLAGTGETTKQIDQAIALKALQSLDDDGRAVLILGGKNIVDPEQRAKAYATSDQVKFWKPLYEQYRVIDHFTIDGDLYKKQGAGWPVDVIVIAGKGKSPIQLPSADGPRIIGDWNGLRAELERNDADRIAAGRYDEDRDRAKIAGVFEGIRDDVGHLSAPRAKPGSQPDKGGRGSEPVGGETVVEPRTDRPADAPAEPTAERLEQPVARETAGSGVRKPAVDLGDAGQQLRVPYVPESKLPSFGIHTPRNLAAPVRQALDRLAAKVGKIDEFVRTKLEYSADAPLHEYYSAEQMDALALAVDAIEANDGLINGDQTGIGKGRVAAGLIRYATNNGMVPVFVTKGADLYSDMLGDLYDTGSGHLVPVFTNNDLTLADPIEEPKEPRKKIWRTKDSTPIMEEIARTGKLPGDVMFTAYSQINSDKPKGYRRSPGQKASMMADKEPPPNGARMDAIAAIASNALFILDESHLASGDSITAWRMSPLLHRAKGVYYSSATFAKRPESMGIYSKTSLGRATTDMEKLVEAMKKGGVPLQQAVSATLASDGLYLRRERDFAGVTFRTLINGMDDAGQLTPTGERDAHLADNYTEGLRVILQISNTMESAADKLNQIIRRLGKKMKASRAPKIESANFAAKLHNMVSQYLLAIKAKSVVERAITMVNEGIEGSNKDADGKPIKEKHKVVIGVYNTMESPIQDLQRSRRELSFTGMLLNYLDQQRELTSGSGQNKQTTVISDTGDPAFANLNDEQLEHHMLVDTGEVDEDGKRVMAINEGAAMEYFRRLMSGALTDAEGRIAELDLGDMPISPLDYIAENLRSAGIKVGERTGRSNGVSGGEIYAKKTMSNAEKVRVVKDFNSGVVDVLITNATTGFSLHSAKKFSDHTPRAMIIAQAHPDINEFMQMLGRIFRTGQVNLPYFELLQTTLPAELRPAAMLALKMAGLNANTTSNAETEVSRGNTSIDIFNEYGDEVVHGYLQGDKQTFALLNVPQITDESGNIKPLTDIQDYYPEDGTFGLKMTGRMAILPTAEQRAFWEKVESDYRDLIGYLNSIGRNNLVSQVVDMQAEVISSTELVAAKGKGQGFEAAATMEKVKAQIGKTPLTAEEVATLADKAGEEQARTFDEWREAATKRQAADIAHKSKAQINWEEGGSETYDRNTANAKEAITVAINYLGQRVHIHDEANGFDAYGAVTSAKLDLEHPLTPSKQLFTVHVNTTNRTMVFSAAQMSRVMVPAYSDDFNALYEATAERSNERFIISGNVLAGFLAIQDTNANARLIQYTDSQNRMLQGILMPGNFTPGDLAKKVEVQSGAHFSQLLDAGRALVSSDGTVQVVKKGGKVVVRVPSSRTMGGQYWRDAQLTRLMDDGQFVEKGGAFVATFPAERNRSMDVFNRLRSLGATLYFQEQAPGGLYASNPIKAVYKDDVEPILKNIGMTAREALGMVQHLVSPSSGVAMDAHDQVMRMLGERNQKGYETDRVLEAYRTMFDKLPRPEQIAFIDRMKTGEKQPSPELQQIADTMRRIDTESWEAAKAAYTGLGFKDNEIPLKWLENHYRVLWKTIPGGPDKGEWIGKARRGLRGSMGQHKQHTLDTMSDGLAEGGVPYSYNPVVMFKLAQADLWKLTSTLKTWKWAKDNGFVQYVRGPFPKAPDGMVELDDSIARVYFPAESGEGLVHAGRYYVEEGFGRLLNNYLSRDVIRSTKIGRGLLWIKNATTSLELSLSVFHGVFETMEMVGSNIGLGMSKLVNRGVLKGDLGAAAEGIMDMIKSPATPVTGFMLGREIRKAAGDPAAYFKTAAGKKMLQAYPRAREMIDDLFTAGWKPNELEQDWKNNSVRTFVDAVSDIKAGASDNYIGAGLRAFPAANEMLMRPLFDHYIPSLKVAQFFAEYAEAIEQNERKLKGGILTRAALARQVWRLVEDRFGELNYDTLFWNANFKTTMQLMFRSVTWKLGSVEAFAGAFAGQGKEFVDAFKERRAPELHRNMAWLFGMLLLTVTMGTILSKVLAGKDPKNLTDAVFPQIDAKDDKVRVSLPTYFKDMVHLIHGPTSYVTSSMSGWIGRVADMLRNKDYYGTQIRDTDAPAVKQALQLGKYAGETLLPFSIRGYKNLSAQDVGALRKSLAIVGVNPAPRFIGQTPAERAAEEYWKGRQTEAGVKPEQFEASREKRGLVAQIRHGESPDVSGALARGTIKPNDVKALYQRAGMGPLASMVNHMSLVDAERIYRKASPTERVQLEGIMARKRSNSLARSGRSMFTGF